MQSLPQEIRDTLLVIRREVHFVHSVEWSLERTDELCTTIKDIIDTTLAGQVHPLVEALKATQEKE